MKTAFFILLGVVIGAIWTVGFDILITHLQPEYALRFTP